MTKNKLLLLLVLLAAVVTGAWATDYTTLAVGDVIKVGDTFSPTADGAFNDFGVSSDKTYTLIRADVDDGYNVTEKTDGAYYVFKYVSIMNPYIHFEKTFAVTAISDGLEVTNIETGKGISYTLALHEPTAPTGYSITLDEGTGNKDSQNWEITPKSSELAGGETVTVTYNGSREVKSVTAVKKAAVDPAKAYLAWNADQKKLVATEIPTTATKVANADAGVEWQAGTYVVEGQVSINGTITLKGNVDLIIKDGATLTANKIQGGNKNLSIYGQAEKSGELVVNCSDDLAFAISNLSTLEVHSAKVTATSSAGAFGGGIYAVNTFNVYGGLLDVKYTGSDGFGIYPSGEGKMNIYGGEVKAVSNGTGSNSYGIMASSDGCSVTVYGGKLWSRSAEKAALKSYLTLERGTGFSGNFEKSDTGNDSEWTSFEPSQSIPDTKYVRVGY